MPDGKAVSKRPWLQFTLRELILATLVVGLGLALVLRTWHPSCEPSGFYRKLQSGDLMREVVKSRLQGVSVIQGGPRSSQARRTLTADRAIYFPGASNQSATRKISAAFKWGVEQSLRENGCVIHDRGTVGDSWQFHYDFRGGSGVVHALVLRRNHFDIENEAMIHFVVIEFAEPNY